MDKTLERILELIPKKETGEFEHGALKKFANSIGLKSGNLIADWVAGRSSSYKRYVHEIAAKYDVSVEWLQGKTDEKAPQPLSVDLGNGEIKPAPKNESGLKSTKYYELNAENRALIDQMIEKLLKSQSDE